MQAGIDPQQHARGVGRLGEEAVEIAILCPITLFTKVDLPTLGLPIIETNPDLCSVINLNPFQKILMVIIHQL